jgi:hypothetical protein
VTLVTDSPHLTRIAPSCATLDGVLLTRSHPLPDGSRVRLRLPHGGDRGGVEALHDRVGAPLDAVRMARILRFDPRSCVSICATMLTGLNEVLVAYGHVDHDGSGSLVVADEALAPGVADLVRAALAERTASRHVA